MSDKPLTIKIFLGNFSFLNKYYNDKGKIQTTLWQSFIDNSYVVLGNIIISFSLAAELQRFNVSLTIFTF